MAHLAMLCFTGPQLCLVLWYLLFLGMVPGPAGYAQKEMAFLPAEYKVYGLCHTGCIYPLCCFHQNLLDTDHLPAQPAVGLVLLLILRREIDTANQIDEIGESEDKPLVSSRSGVWKKLKYIISHKEDRQYFKLFQWVSLCAVAVYIITINSLDISILIGSFPFLLLAFGVLLGIGNIIATVSVLARFNFHLLFFIFSLLLGKFVDPHFTELTTKEKTNTLFSERQTLKEYFSNWVNNPVRKNVLDDTTIKRYPVYFVIANGGASRSGYWVASILSKLQDTTGGKFANHLFCLSGASGGSVGNATFSTCCVIKNSLLQKIHHSNGTGKQPPAISNQIF